ncbi:hypothetical protein CesoFtcFv8_016552 [Champsocephalus esox]|uniref:Uncharacterized protein n=1 Tax=Champsocephalus esox TaxID=159716 RepID=A0AAN8GTI8_9TELE|nr:hypothetical protein CesoFtcFv8_016552 [Champsocephalus esox]
MRGQRVMENECRCWNPAVWLLVSLLGSLVLVAVSVLRHGDLKINRRAVNTDVSMQYQGKNEQDIRFHTFPDTNVQSDMSAFGTSV